MAQANEETDETSALRYQKIGQFTFGLYKTVAQPSAQFAGVATPNFFLVFLPGAYNTWITFATRGVDSIANFLADPVRGCQPWR